MKTLSLLLAACLTLCACSSPEAVPKAVAATNSGPLPDLTGGKPFLPENCVEDAKVAYAILEKRGAHPTILEIFYRAPGPASAVNDTSYGHVVVRFAWDGGYSTADRQGGGSEHRVILPATVNPKDARAVGSFLFWTCYLAAWTTPESVRR